jgi:hypothetical protein
MASFEVRPRTQITNSERGSAGSLKKNLNSDHGSHNMMSRSDVAPTLRKIMSNSLTVQ